MAHDREYFHRRAAETRSAAYHKDDAEGVEIAGHLALAYAALARRRAATPAVDATETVAPLASSPLMLLD